MAKQVLRQKLGMREVGADYDQLGWRWWSDHCFGEQVPASMQNRR